MTRYLCKWFLAIVCLGWVVFSQTGVALASTGPDIPDIKGDVYVQDNAHVLTQKETEDIIKVSEKLYSKSTAQVAVMTVETTGSYSIEEYANAAFRKYGIGDKKKNNGVLILVAMKDHHIRIEVGYGLEGAIPDSKAGDIIEEDAIPQLKAGHPDQAILKTYQAVVDETAKEYHLNPKDFQVGEVKDPTPQSDQQGPDPVLVLCFWFVLFYVGLAVYLRFHKTPDMPQTSRDFSDIGSVDVGSSDWGGGFSDSGGGGFSDSGGGGSSGGGGASGSW
jgi:uncharacterized protein